MGLTIAIVNQDSLIGSLLRVADITFDSSYPTGGESLTPQMLGLTVIDFINAPAKGGYSFEYDRTNKKLKALYATGGGVEAIPFAGIQDAVTAGATKYIGPADNAENANEDISFVVPLAGQIVGMYASLGTANGAAGENTKKIDLTVMKNGVATTMTCSLIADSKAANDTAAGHAVTVAAGDLIDVKSVAAAAIAGADLNLTIMYKPTVSNGAEVPNTTNLSTVSTRALIVGR